MVELNIRTAQVCELDSYLALLNEVAEWLHERGVSPLPPGFYSQFREFYADSISLGEVYLAFVGDELVGAVRLTKNDGVVWPAEDRDAICLENLVVRRGWSHHGIGRYLLSWAERETAKAGQTTLRLDCFANNLILRKYYEDAGYTGCGEVYAHYPFGNLTLQRYAKQVS